MRINVLYGAVNHRDCNIEGNTVRDVYDETQSLFGLPSDVTVRVTRAGESSAREASMDDSLSTGDTVEFVKTTGTKG